ncbi:P-loop containing nucleoside triphosphate hydrolase protein [Xylaria curta]|nr:P-loop containing nucleoside triphosphate hydrolase protein [Xylaria curta]
MLLTMAQKSPLETAQGFVIYLSIRLLNKKTASPGSFIRLLMCWGTFTSSLDYFYFSGVEIAQTAAKMGPFLDILDTKPTVDDKEGAQPMRSGEGEIEFHNVTFGYDARTIVLKDISFHVLPGKAIAFVGESGNSESTILNTLFRLYDVTAGQILINGQDVQDVTQHK